MRYTNIQALRAVAAWSVLVHHLIDSLNHYVAALGIEVTAFAAGVPVFFTLSGFVMAESTARRSASPGLFLRARLGRIVPLYWLLTLVAAGAVAMSLRLFGQEGVAATRLLESLLFLPSFGPGGAVVEPVLFVGWSLNYEMLFYVVFATSLLASGRARQGIVLAALLIGLMAAGTLSDNPWLRYYGSPVLMQFGAGVVIWHLAQVVRPGRRTGWAVIGLAAGAFVVAALPGSPLEALPGWVRNGAPAALLVFGAVALEHAGVAARDGFMLRQGDASYSLYLLHPFVLQVVGKVAILSGLTATGVGLVATVALAGVTSLIAAEWCYRRVELPLTRAATALLQVPRRGGSPHRADSGATSARPRTV